MNVVNIPISELVPYARHARKTSNVVRGLAESIRQFGFQQPIVLDRDRTIICGHARYLAAKRLGLKEVPCVLADELSPEAATAYRLIDNKLGELATWDPALLSEELEKIRVDFAAFEIDFAPDLARDVETPNPADAAPPDAILDDRPAKSKRGDDGLPKSYRIIVTCDDEDDQEELFDRLVAEGYKVKLCNL